MSILKTFEVSCPYCGKKRTHGTNEFSGREFIECQPARTGCNKTFVVKWDMKVASEVSKLDFKEE